MTQESLLANCPKGYTVVILGQNFDMLGKTEFWRIYENHPEPFLTRIPEDFIDTESGSNLARIPREWGRLLYYKLI